MTLHEFIDLILRNNIHHHIMTPWHHPSPILSFHNHFEIILFLVNFSPRHHLVTAPVSTLSRFLTPGTGWMPSLCHPSTSTWTHGPSGRRWGTVSASLSCNLEIAAPHLAPFLKTNSATTPFNAGMIMA